MKKILLTTVGTLGDLNPLIALGKILKESYVVTIATTSFYEKNVKAAGVNFIPLSPHYDPKSPELCKAILHPTKTLFNIHKLIWTEENIESSVKEILSIVKDYDLVIGNTFSYSAKIACLKTGTKWGSINLSPTCFFSHQDPPELYPLNFLSHFPRIHRFFFKYGIRILFSLVDHWGKRIHSSYKKNELEPAGNLLLDAPMSNDFNLVLFPEVLGNKQSDWPINTYQSSFLLYSGEGHPTLKSELIEFINSGKKPILFTFGSTVGLNADQFLPKILKTIDQLSSHERIILTLSKDEVQRYKNRFNENVFLCDFLPYDQAMKHMGLVIHQGGIGTVSSCLFGGVRQILLPACTDQFDNAFRIKRENLGDSLPMNKLNDQKLLKKIKEVYSDQAMESRVLEVKENLLKRDVKDEILEIFSKVLK